MVRRRRYSFTPRYFVNLGFSLAVLVVFALAGIRIAQTTSAATANPYGSADYCALEDNTTVIYGWAVDPDAGSLTQPAVVVNLGAAEINAATNRTGYRDEAVNNWIDANRKGDPKPGAYGFRVSVPGLYKGTVNPISGTVLNEGSGSSVILTVNNTSYTDGDRQKPFFRDNVIPEECLAKPDMQPVSAPPAPAQPTMSKITGTAVTVGTLAADFRVRADNAATVQIIYGKDPIKLDQSSSDVPLREAEKTLTLTGLEPAAGYAYRVIRTDAAGKKTTSSMGTFDTLGFVVALHFVDNRNKGLQGIAARINGQDTAKTSNQDGDVQFTGLPAGNHTVSYSYLEKQFTKTVVANASTISPAEATAASVVTLDYAINIEAALAARTKPAAKQRDDPGAVIGIALTVGAAILVFTVYKLTGRKHSRYQPEEAGFDVPAPPLPGYQPLTPQMPPLVPRQSEAQHMGESLKKMVIRTMTEESVRNRTNDCPRK